MDPSWLRSWVRQIVKFGRDPFCKRPTFPKLCFTHCQQQTRIATIQLFHSIKNAIPYIQLMCCHVVCSRYHK